MKLHLFRYERKNCESCFKSPQLFGNVYGEFLMRSISDDVAYLNSFYGKVFDEVEKIFKESAPFNQSQNARFKKTIGQILHNKNYFDG